MLVVGQSLSLGLEERMAPESQDFSFLHGFLLRTPSQGERSFGRSGQACRARPFRGRMSKLELKSRSSSSSRRSSRKGCKGCLESVGLAKSNPEECKKETMLKQV